MQRLWGERAAASRAAAAVTDDEKGQAQFRSSPLSSTMSLSGSPSNPWPVGPSLAGDFCRRGRGKRRLLRRIEAARGYLDLRMPAHALDELDLVGDEYHFQQARLRGEAFLQLGRYEKAVDSFRCALGECPDSLPVLVGLAECHTRRENIDQAIAALEEADRLHPGEPAVLYARACCAARQDDVDGALSWLARAIRICPEAGDWVRRDPVFSRLRRLPDFSWFIAVAQDNATQ